MLPSVQRANVKYAIERWHGSGDVADVFLAEQELLKASRAAWLLSAYD